jgi:membrane peptidoglycan carboxypeptidase
LPAHYTRLVSAKDDAAANQAAQDIKDPLARLIAAGLLLKQSRATPQTLTTAIDTASERGWQRPLLMWLKIEQQRAQNAGDQKSAHSLQRRIELTLGNLAP